MEEIQEETETEHNLRLNEINVKYLYLATNYLNQISSNTLRCHWNILLADIMGMKNIAFSKHEKREKLNCMYCLCPWRNGLFSVKVLPKAKRKKKCRKLIRKVEAGMKLSKVQKNLAQAMDSRSTLVLNCKICHKSSKFKISQYFQSFGTVEELVSKSTQEVENTEKSIKKKKKKKKKPKNKKSFCGLNPEVVKKVQGDLGRNNIVQREKPIDKSDAASDDDIIVIENIDDITIIDDKSRKRKMDDVTVLDILKPKPEKVIKLGTETNGILDNPSPVTPLGMKCEKSLQKYPRFGDFIPLDGSHSKPKTNEQPKTWIHNQKRKKRKRQNMITEQCNAVNVDKPGNGKNKKNLNKWKRLIAEEDSKAPRSSSLKDFLSSI